MERLLVNDFLEKVKGNVLLDVRSPAEYKHAHMPGATSFPLFTDEERKIVGTAYKQESREKAIKIGLDIFGPKMRRMVEEAEALVASHNQNAPINTINGQPSPAKEIFIYCWRGGMRSGAVAWLLNLYGFRVFTLAGGYKSFRNYVLKSFQQPYDFKILGGYTGSGKTEVLQELKRAGEKIIDLEQIANHKGSAFGNINMPPQPSQEMFENLLSMELRALTQEDQSSSAHATAGAIWLEDESQRIGNINLPNDFWDSMRRSPVYFLDIPFQERLKHIVEEYGCLDKEKLDGAIRRISKRLGGLESKMSLEFLAENKIEDCFRILLQYYDKRYQKGLTNRENLASVLFKIECETVSAANASLLQQKNFSLPAGDN